jgi:hypothetical protein
VHAEGASGAASGGGAGPRTGARHAPVRPLATEQPTGQPTAAERVGTRRPPSGHTAKLRCGPWRRSGRHGQPTATEWVGTRRRPGGGEAGAAQLLRPAPSMYVSCCFQLQVGVINHVQWLFGNMDSSLQKSRKNNSNNVRLYI